jgi:hypothetical protein
MVKKIRNDTAGGPAFPKTVFEPYLSEEERMSVARPVRRNDPTQDNDESPLSANPNFISINKAFPHIGKKLKVCWGHQEFVDCIHSLVHDTRGNTRSGFPLDVLLALQSLSDEQGRSHPEILPKETLWSHIEDR